MSPVTARPGPGGAPRSGVRRLVLALVAALDRILQVLVPSSSRRICYFSVPDYTDNAYWVYRHALRTRSDLEHVWLVKDTSVAERVHEELEEVRREHGARGHRVQVVDKNRPQGYWAYLRSGVSFHTHGLYAFSRWTFRREVVCLWHGVGIKAIDRLNRTNPAAKRPFGTRHVATSHFYRYVIATATGVDPAAVWVTGNPRCDPLTSPHARATPDDRVRALLDLPPDRHLILWLPTFRVLVDPWVAGGSGSGGTGARSFLDNLPTWAMPALEQACAEHGCTVVVKLHPLDALNHASQRLAGRHVRLLPAAALGSRGVQLYDLLATADGLMTDLSSVVVDWLVTGRPVGLIAVEPDDHEHDLLFPPELMLRNEPFRALDEAADVERFVRAVRTGDRAAGPTRGVAPMLYEDVEGSSAEAIWRRLGR